jgi:hypothetical protein
MRLRNTIVVLILAAIIGGYALVVLLASRPVPAPTLYKKLAAKNISRIDLRYSNSPEIELVRNPDHTWRIVKPIKADADQGQIDSLTDSLAHAPLKTTIVKKPASLAPFGLNKPSVVVTITSDKAGALPALDVGKMSPVGGGVYVKLANSPAVLMTSESFPSAVTKHVNDLRSHLLMTFNMGDANKVTIQSPSGGEIEVDKKDSKWRIVKPSEYLADSDTVAQLLTALVNARVKDFVSNAPKDLSKYGLDKPQLEVTVFTGKDDTRHSLLFGLTEPNAYQHAIYVKRGAAPYVFSVRDSLIGKVDLTVFDLRDKTVMAFDPDKVGRIEIGNRGEKYTLDLGKSGKWQIVSDGKTMAADGSAVQTFLDELANLKGSAIVADPMKHAKKYGLEKPTETITVYYKDGKKVGTVNLAQLKHKIQVSESTPASMPGAPAKQEMKTVMRFDNYAHSTAGTPVYSLKEATFSQFDMKASQFQPTQPIEPTPAPTSAAKKS